MKHRKQNDDCGKFAELKPVLRKWHNLNSVYLNKNEFDCPWWYNERASISILAAAAWKCGYTALEEFSTVKRKVKRDRHEPGRCDLRIRVGSKEFQFEAKQVRARLGNKRKKDDIKIIWESILDSLNRARRDAGRLDSKGVKRLGLLFVSPIIPITLSDDLDDRLDNLIDLLKKKKKRNEIDAISWFFANDWKSFKDEHNIYPGVFLLIREARKFQKPRTQSSGKKRRSA